MGASLLAKASAHPTSIPPDPLPSLASQLPQWIFSGCSICVRHRSNVGASLLAKASAHSTSIEPDPPPSLASQLPQTLAMTTNLWSAK
ncbi:hypothetical protein DBR18_19640 [Pseudomonas sp. HMWF021]|nr:hypothetical protein DBR18_19640 [Pseudomonas sp. HMWF021]